VTGPYEHSHEIFCSVNGIIILPADRLSASQEGLCFTVIWVTEII
jgi:hypothetical protein